MSSSIEEQFQPPEWATKEEVIKAAQHYINYWKIEARSRNQQWLDAMAENARLKAEVEAQAKRWAESEDLISHYKQQMDKAINDCQCSRLKAEVERLRNAGDAMAEELIGRYFGNRLVTEWNAAKEGKPTP